MPWCEECSRYWAPSAMSVEGTCPTCGRDLDAPGGHDHGADAAAPDEGTPWHFKLLVVAMVAYLVWRFFQLFFG